MSQLLTEFIRNLASTAPAQIGPGNQIALTATFSLYLVEVQVQYVVEGVSRGW